MPVTPFHFGPGALIKAAVPKSFSFLIFLASQFVMDSEPVYYGLKGEPPLHRIFHTYLGSHIVIAVTVLIVGPLLSKILRKPFSFKVTLVSAMAGAYSHVFLDGLMHADMVPFAPFSNANPFLRAVNLGHLHWFCLLSGILALVILGIRKLKQNGQPSDL